MHAITRLRAVRLLTVLCICSAVLSATGLAAARPGNGNGNGKPVGAPAEPAWPSSHAPENDPKPGEAGFLPDELPAPPASEGMTDEELMRADPSGFAKMRAERASIERALLNKVRTELKAHGVTPASENPLDAAEAQSAASVLAALPYSPYSYLVFTLTPNYTSPYARTGYLGMLYFTYGLYSATTDSYRWFTVGWPARSGDNIPSHQSWIGRGPAPAYTYDFGFMYGSYRGYEPDGRAEFYPGKWRLDPWTGAPYGRSCLEVHGGQYSHEFAATSGCIRIHPSSITSLRSYYIYKMANKYDRSSAHLIVRY